MIDEPIKPIDNSLSPATKAYIGWLEFCKKQFDDYVSKTCGLSEEQLGKPAPRENLK